MKTRLTIILITVCAILTLSFTFKSVLSKQGPPATETHSAGSAPIGGFVIDQE